jgi:hypothetical protein
VRLGDIEMAATFESTSTRYKPDIANVKGKQCAIAIPPGGYFPDAVEQGRFGTVFPKTPANYGFTIIAKIIAGREQAFHDHAKKLETAVRGDPGCLAILRLHFLKWLLFPINGETYFMYQGIFDTDFDKYTEDAVSLFGSTGIDTVFENLEGFPSDWKTNPAAFVQFVRDHHHPSFLEYGEYSYTSNQEVTSAIAVRKNLADVLDNMQL